MNSARGTSSSRYSSANARDAMLPSSARCVAPSARPTNWKPVSNSSPKKNDTSSNASRSPSMLRAARRPCLTALSQCSTRRRQPNTVSVKLATSPAANTCGSLLCRQASTTTPSSSASPLPCRNPTSGTTPMPTPTMSHGRRRPPRVSTASARCRPSKRSTSSGTMSMPRSRHSCCTNALMRASCRVSNTAYSRASMVTRMPHCNNTAASSRPMKLAPTMTAWPPRRAPARSACTSPKLRRWWMPARPAPGTASGRGCAPVATSSRP